MNSETDDLIYKIQKEITTLEERIKHLEQDRSNDVKQDDYKFDFKQLQIAYDKAEQDTANHFDGKTCSMRNIEGIDTCPICYFRMQVKSYLREMGMQNHA